MLYALLVERYRAPCSEETLLLSGVWSSVSATLRAELEGADATPPVTLGAGVSVPGAGCELGVHAAALRAEGAAAAGTGLHGHTPPRRALPVKQPWVDTILSGGKTWEVRSTRTTFRGRVHLAQSGTGMLVGEVRITDCIAVTKAMLARCVKKHRITRDHSRAVANYRRVFAWVLADAMRYSSPISYRHPPGAVIWVRTDV